MVTVRKLWYLIWIFNLLILFNDLLFEFLTDWLFLRNFWVTLCIIFYTLYFRIVINGTMYVHVIYDFKNLLWWKLYNRSLDFIRNLIDLTNIPILNCFNAMNGNYIIQSNSNNIFQKLHYNLNDVKMFVRKSNVRNITYKRW